MGIGRPWKPEDTRKRVNNAYPRVIGNLGMLCLSDHEGRIPLMMIRYDECRSFLKRSRFKTFSAGT